MPDMPQGPLNLPAPHDDAAAAGTLNNDDWISAISNLLARGETIIWQHLKDSKWQWKKGTGLAATYFYYPPGVSKASVPSNAVEGREYFVSEEAAVSFAVLKAQSLSGGGGGQ